MATITRTAMTLEELASWLGNRKENARLYLSDLGYQTDKRKVCVQAGQPGYFLKKSWIKIQPGDVVQLKNGDIEVID